MKKKRETVQAGLLLLKLSFQWNPLYVVVLVCHIIVEILLPFPAIIFPALIVDELLDGQVFERILLPVLILAGSTFTLTLLKVWILKNQNLLQSGFKDYLNARISEKQMHVSLAQIESVNVQELFVRANSAVSGDISYALRSLGGDRGIDAIGTESVNLMSGFVKVIVLTTALTRLGIVPALLIVAVLLFHAFGGNRERRANYAERVKTTPYRNKNQYVSSIMIDFRYAKEIRLFGLPEFLAGKFRQNKEHFYAAREEAKYAFYFSHFLGILGDLVQAAVTYGYLAAMVFKKILTLGEFTGYAAVLNNLSSTLVSMVRSYLNFNLYMEYFVDFNRAMALDDETTTETPEKAAGKGMDGEATIEDAIVFRNVSYSYPGTKVKALDQVSLEIPLKGSISIVGQNGSGKSTLIKLLLRLYRPDEGSILFKGRDIWSIPLQEYREQVTAVFQDFAIFALSIKDNIAAGETYDNRVGRALRQAGIWDVVERLPHKTDTKLFRNYNPDGIDLSGGEKQKLAIARMLYQDSSVMVLDEPTAALDPRSELEIYQQVHRLAKDKVVLYISHRMSSCHFSDLVLVMENGRLIQQGTHEELLGQEGLYLRMYRSQAECYQA